MKQHNKHIILYPLSVLYGLVTGFRNWLFDQDILSSTSFDIPIISIGNLSVGGTGKTPHTEYILSILQNEWKTAMLSRGYKRKKKGFYLANEKSNSQTLGDEPFQIYTKYPEVIVAVDEKRVHGVKKLQELKPDLQVVVLDDAYQHRFIQQGLSILLTDYNNLYSRDLLLPAGELREWKSGSTRANIIIVTKCPADIKPMELRVVEMELKPETNQHLFFSGFSYYEIVPVFPESAPEVWTYERMKENDTNVLLVAGIVSPQPIAEHLKNFATRLETLFYADHHVFTARDFVQISNLFNAFTSPEKIILVTEKDAARLVSNPLFPEVLKSWTFALPIGVKILHDQETLFIQKIKNYVVENSRNR